MKNNLLRDNKNLNTIVVIIIFLLSAVFRVFFLNLIEFKADQAISFFQIFEFFQNPQLIQVGLISSVGTYNFPLFNYILIILSLFYRSPQFLSFLIALLNSFLIVLFYVFIRKFYDLKTSVVSSLIIASSPWAILFSRSIWAQDLILLFIIPIVFLVHQIILNKKEGYTLPLFVLLTLFCQLHSSGFFFFITTLFVFVVLKIKIKIKKALQGIGAGLIFAIPYFVFELFSTPFCRDCQSLLIYLQKYPKSFDLSNFLRPFQIINGSFFQYEMGKDFQAFLNYSGTLIFLNFLFIFESIFVITGIILILKYLKKYRFLIIYFFAMPFLFLITKTSSYPHYYVSLIPISALITSVCFSFLINKNKILGLSLIFIFLFSNILFETYFYAYLNKKQNINGDYGPVYSLTDSFINKQLKEYALATNYEELKYYALIFSQSNLLHQNLGNYFLNRRELDEAKIEYEKQLTITPNSSFSLANLAYIYILEKDYASAGKILDKLEHLDKTTADQLRGLIK